MYRLLCKTVALVQECLEQVAMLTNGLMEVYSMAMNISMERHMAKAMQSVSSAAAEAARHPRAEAQFLVKR
jgi:hypothetical protein